MRTLKHSYLQVKTKNQTTFGGNQAWFSYRFLRRMGCGVISATDVLLHLRGKEEVSELEYMDFAKQL